MTGLIFFLQSLGFSYDQQKQSLPLSIPAYHAWQTGLRIYQGDNSALRLGKLAPDESMKRDIATKELREKISRQCPFLTKKQINEVLLEIKKRQKNPEWLQGITNLDPTATYTEEMLKNNHNKGKKPGEAIGFLVKYDRPVMKFGWEKQENEVADEIIGHILLLETMKIEIHSIITNQDKKKVIYRDMGILGRVNDSNESVVNFAVCDLFCGGLESSLFEKFITKSETELDGQFLINLAGARLQRWGWKEKDIGTLSQKISKLSDSYCRQEINKKTVIEELPFELLWEVVQLEWVIFDIFEGKDRCFVTLNLLPNRKDNNGNLVGIGQAYEEKAKGDICPEDLINNYKSVLYFQKQIALELKNLDASGWENLYNELGFSREDLKTSFNILKEKFERKEYAEWYGKKNFAQFELLVRDFIPVHLAWIYFNQEKN